MVTELKKTNGEVLKIIDGKYVIGASSGCFATKQIGIVIDNTYFKEENILQSKKIECTEYIDYYDWYANNPYTALTNESLINIDGDKMYVPSIAEIYINAHPGSLVSSAEVTFLGDNYLITFYDVNFFTGQMVITKKFYIRNVKKIEITNSINHFAAMCIWICVPENSLHFSSSISEIIGV